MRISTLAAALLALCSFLIPACASAQTDAKGFIRLTPEQTQWKDVPGGHGVQTAVVSGDPSKAGVYVIRVKLTRAASARRTN